ncbi:MAG TPA: response regulator [Planococcus sp. (in: firmicutes)]|nr:response regulator [Planococcus sp. (in: firmicutes)]
MINVMIVEDDPMIAALNRQYTQQLDGFRVAGIAANTQQAAELLAQQKIQLILLDIHMPGLNGLDFLRWVREENLELDVILITAASDIQPIQQALRLGAVDYLIKPFEFSRFQEALEQYSKHHHRLEDKNNVNQQELDRMLRKKSPAAAARSVYPKLPKGLTKTTLQTINEKILASGTEAFSTEEIAEASRISRVSVRKYLKFLTEIAYLEETLVYGVGRPIYHYRLQTAHQSHINTFL